jgi:hypothetical protein
MIEKLRILNRQLELEMNRAEERLIKWRKGYQQYLQILAEFRRWQAGFNAQMALHEQHLHNLQGMYENRKQAKHIPLPMIAD